MKIRSATVLSVSSLALGLVFGASLAQAQEPVKVTFATNWLAQAEHGGYYQAVADGTYRACGIDVTIQMGGPQVDGRALLLSGKIDFFMGANLLDVFNAIEQNIPLKIVAAHFQKEPQIMMSHPGQGLDTWEDLKKAEAIIVSDGAIQTFFRWMVTKGFDANKRQSYTFDPAPFLANKKSIQQGYVTSEPFAIEQAAGFKPNVFLIGDNGFETYSTTVEVMSETIEKRPEVVKCFVQGSNQGWFNYLHGDNKAANEMIKKDNPGMTDAQIAYSISALKQYGIVQSGDADTLGIGAITPEKVDSFYKEMVAAGVAPAGLDVTKGYDVQFTNNGVGKK
jgi:NitT/TauT family transport system substrate-binding protein